MKLSTIELTGNVLIDRKVVLSGNVIPNKRLLLNGALRISTSTGGVYPIYQGPYDVIPQTYEQSLETKKKLMTDNVTVEEIPYSEVSNDFGKTAVIAS